MDREVLFRGKRPDSGEWVYGCYAPVFGALPIIITGAEMEDDCSVSFDFAHVIPSTVGRFTGLSDKNCRRIFEGDIVQYLDTVFGEYDCKSVVCLGEYEQDGSGGEYTPTECCGFYVEIEYHSCPDWDDEGTCFPEYKWQQNLLEVFSQCEVIGNIHDNPELMEPGTSLKAAGWKCVGQAGGLRWTGKRRPDVDLYPAQMKIKWEVSE